MDGRPTWTDRDEAGDYVVPNVLSPRDLVSRPDKMDETVPHSSLLHRFCVIVLTMREVIAVNGCASDIFCIYRGFLFISCQFL